MGYFSWITGDEKKQIKIEVQESVYLLLPDGTHIQEDCYRGYGVFGECDAYEELAKMNGITSEDAERMGIPLRELGIDLEHGKFLCDIKTGKFYAYTRGKQPFFEWIESFSRYDSELDSLCGETPNDMLEKGVFVEVPARNFMLRGRKWKPIKLSFDEDATYDETPPATDDIHQGW